MDYFATYFLEIFTSVTWQQLVMYLIGGALIWLAIKKEYEPALLLPMGFGAILVNLPSSNALTQQIAGIGEVQGIVSWLYETGIAASEALPLLLFIGIALNANAQLLWKISGNGLEKPSYILGTHHLAPLSIKDSIAGLPQAVDGTSQVYGEVVMSEAMSPEFMQTMQQNMMMAGDTTLQVLFTPEQYELVGKAVKENLMADIAMLAKMKPAFITQQLTLILCMKHLGGFNPQEQLDTYFQQQAIQSGKKVGGLETPISQINVLLNSQTLQRQANLLYCLVSDIDKAMDQTKRLNNAYKAQNLDEMLKLMEERDGNSCDPQPGEMEDLLDNRNKAWIEKMPSIMKEIPTLFVVGAGHLPGTNGVLKLLKEKGYTVEPMK